MRLLRPAPREVYRLYDEEAFLARDGRRDDPSLEASDEEWLRLRRATVAVMLLGAIGALGALISLNGLHPANGVSRRLGARLRAASRPSAPLGVSRVQVSNSRASRGRPRAAGIRDDRAIGAGGRWRPGRRSLQSVRSPRRPDLPMSMPQPRGIARLIATAVAISQPSARPEFGFER
jgi:hypothetical protein